jgi:gluconate 5-dehydrogenase
MFSLSNKIALVTGGSRGIGLAIAQALGQAGATVVITARKKDELLAAKNYLSDLGIETIALQHDLSDRSTTVALVAQIIDQVGGIDILVNNAGATWGATAIDHSQDAWDKVVGVNLNGTWALTQEVARSCMIPRRSGSIITIASVAGMLGNAPHNMHTIAYNTTKGAQINMVRALAGEWGQLGIRVNAILPGWFPTKMTHATLENDTNVVQSIPLGRLGEDVDLFGPIVFLASDASQYVTGHALAVDGGMLAVK